MLHESMNIMQFILDAYQLLCYIQTSGSHRIVVIHVAMVHILHVPIQCANPIKHNVLYTFVMSIHTPVSWICPMHEYIVSTPGAWVHYSFCPMHMYIESSHLCMSSLLLWACHSFCPMHYTLQRMSSFHPGKHVHTFFRNCRRSCDTDDDRTHDDDRCSFPLAVRPRDDDRVGAETVPAEGMCPGATVAPGDRWWGWWWCRWWGDIDCWVTIKPVISARTLCDQGEAQRGKKWQDRGTQGEVVKVVPMVRGHRFPSYDKASDKW